MQNIANKEVEIFMTKNKKSNLSPKKGIAKNKRVLIIIVLLFVLSLGIIGLSMSKRDNIFTSEPAKYFTGNLYSANHAANMFDYAYTDNNLIISPYNVNTSLAILYNATDNNSNKEIKTYYKVNTSKVNEEMTPKLASIEEKELESTKYTKLYTSYINSIYDKSYDSLTIDTIKLLSTEEKKEMLLTIKKIKLTISCIDGTSDYSEKYIKNYKLTEEELNFNDYSLKSELEEIIDYDESYSIKNEVNNYTEIYSKELNITEDFEKNTSIYQYSFNPNESNQISTASTLSEENTIDEITLVSTLEFEYEWENSYKTSSVKDVEFYNINNDIEAVEIMYEIKDSYLENEYARGFKKDFENGKYSYVAILPKNSGDFELSSLDLDSLLLSQKQGMVLTGIPKMSYSNQIDLKPVLANYGINEIFTDKANFTRLSDNPIYVGQMSQKISLKIAERGTVETNIYSTTTEESTETSYEESIILDRPYAYLIINNETNDIMFIGKVVKINESN